MSRHARQIGTTDEALDRAEQRLGRKLPGSFRRWLLEHNGTGLDGAEVFPVLDDRDPRKTWDSIVRQNEMWESYCADALPPDPLSASLLPFASLGTGDYYCFDFGHAAHDGEPQVVHWSHETGMTSPRGASFSEFVVRLSSGEFAND